MDQNIEATYMCKVHGYFTVIHVNNPVKAFPCPQCEKPSTLHSYAISGEMPLDRLEEARKALIMLRDSLRNQNRPAAPQRPLLPEKTMGASGSGQGSETTEKKNDNPNKPSKPVLESVIHLHEVKERAKMEEAIAAALAETVQDKAGDDQKTEE
jgi:hypothetical protein